MASAAHAGGTGWLDRLLPNRLLASVSALLAAAAMPAILRGHADWQHVPVLVWLHLVTVLAATALTPVMLLRAKGTRQHRVRDHESAVRGMVIGALLVAGWFTFAFHRMLGAWLLAPV